LSDTALGEWKLQEGATRKNKKKVHLQATRQSPRLKGQRGISVEEMATKRKQIQNLEVPGKIHNNAFVVLNNIEDSTLLQTAKDLGISLAESEEDCRVQIIASKVEERLRANLDEATYQAHLENLKLKEGLQDDECLDLTAIDNRKRSWNEAPGSQGDSMGKKNKNQRETKKKKKK
jgi:hypothetical protein